MNKKTNEFYKRKQFILFYLFYLFHFSILHLVQLSIENCINKQSFSSSYSLSLFKLIQLISSADWFEHTLSTLLSISINSYFILRRSEILSCNHLSHYSLHQSTYWINSLQQQFELLLCIISLILHYDLFFTLSYTIYKIVRM